MWLPLIIVAVALTSTALAAPTLTERSLPLAESFEGDLTGWTLQLNRGAEGTMAVAAGGVLGANCLQVTPTRLSAPDDQSLPSNVHLRYETLALEAGTPYRLSVWMRAQARKLVTLRVRRRAVEASVASGPIVVGPQWQRAVFEFTLPEDYPDATPQLMLAEDLTPIWIDGVTLGEIAAEEPLAPADYLQVAEIAGGSAALVRFASDFDDEAHGWQMQLNRGAQAEMALEDGCIRVSPQALCAPDNQQMATNIHLKCEGLSLLAGTDYVYSVRLRSESPRTVGLRLRAATGDRSLPIATVEAGPEWQSFEAPFRLDEPMPDAVAQILLGDATSPVWLDEVVIREARCGDTLPAGVIARGNLWLRPEVLAATTGAGALPGLTELVRDLPESFRLNVALEMMGARAVRLGLSGDAGTTLVSIGEEVATTGTGGEELLREPLSSEQWSPGQALTLRMERTGGLATLTIGEMHEVALGEAQFDRLLIGGQDGATITLLRAEGAEMLPLERPDGSTEKEEYADPVTGRRIVRLTHSPCNDKHPYYDISTWSPDGTMIVFSSALPGEKSATVYVLDADGTNIRAIGTGESFNMHTGAFPMWAPDSRSVYFQTRVVDASGERVQGMKRVWLDSGHTEEIPIAARQVSLATGDLLWMENGRAEGDPVRGLYAAEADGSGRRLLFETAAMEALSPSRDRHDQCASLGLTNCKWSPDGTKVMVVLVGYDAGGAQLVKEIYIANADGSDLHFVMTFAHHHIWHPNSQQVIANCDDGLYIVNADGSGRRKISDLAQGHPSFSPDGSMIVTDAYGQGYENMVVLIDPQTGDVTPLASVPTVHGRSHETGTHIHPCWAPDGRSVIYDSDQEGHCQVYQVFVE